MDSPKEQQIINLKKIVTTLWACRRRFVVPLCVGFIVSCAYILSLPRYYDTEAKLAPEMGGSLDGGTLGSIASAFGFNFGDMQTTDAITPLLYPDLMDDNAFVTKLFDIEVETQKGDVKATYYDYLLRYQKKPWWSFATSWIGKLLSSDDNNAGVDKSFNPYTITKKQTDIANLIRRKILLSVDKKTGVITINLRDQDPLVCKTLGDSIISQLQAFITDYRTNKARVDMDYYTALVEEARNEYKEAHRAYAAFSDANMHVVLQSQQTKMNELENEMQLKFQAYSALSTQMQAARVKVQERTPVFTILKGAAIPVKPSGPKRMVFVAGMMLLIGIAESLYILYKEKQPQESTLRQEQL